MNQTEASIKVFREVWLEGIYPDMDEFRPVTFGWFKDSDPRTATFAGIADRIKVVKAVRDELEMYILCKEIVYLDSKAYSVQPATHYKEVI